MEGRRYLLWITTGKRNVWVANVREDNGSGLPSRGYPLLGQCPFPQVLRCNGFNNPVELFVSINSVDI